MGHNKTMKKCFVGFLCAIFCFVLGCTSETELKIAHISEMTVGNGTNYSIRVTLDEDDRMEERFVDLQVKADKENQFIEIGEENVAHKAICFEKKDYWYNLTYLLSDENVEEYQTYKDYGTKIFNFTSKSDVKLTFRVVAGKVKQNETTGEKILVLGESISDEVTIDVKKDK